MGKIKSKTIRRSAKILEDQGIEFSDNFEENKKMLADTMPSKKIRNQMAGYLVNVRKQQKKKQEAMKTK